MKSITLLPEFYPDDPASPLFSGDSRLRYYDYNSDKAQLRTLRGQFRQLTRIIKNTIYSVRLSTRHNISKKSTESQFAENNGKPQ